MARYRKISVEIWNDERFRDFSDDAKLIFLFLLSHPHMTSLGAMRGTVPGLAAEIGWRLKRFTKAFNELLTEGRAKHDTSAAFVWLPKFLKHNGPENKNVVMAMAKTAALLPECSMKQDLLQHVTEFLKGYGKGFAEAFHEPSAKGMPTPEPEPEPDSPLPPKGEWRRAFETFWEAYPRKEGKGRVEKWFEKHRPDEALLEQMLGKIVIAQQSQKWTKDEGQFIPMPATWLNEKRWEDEPIASRAVDSTRCVWPISNGRHPKTCGKSVHGSESHCIEHLPLHQAEQDHIARLQASVAG